MSATLGGLIKDYRQQKNISQLEIAFALGWKEPSRLSRIEQGIVEKPKIKLLERIMNIMDLKESERNSFLLAGGYLPSREEIVKVRKETTPIIENWNYPAYILDFSWRMIHWNKAAAWVYKIDKESEKIIHENLPRTLDIVFDKSFIQNKHLKGKELKEWHKFLKSKLVLFKHAQRNRTKEQWYTTHIKQMMENDLFRKLWPQAKIPEEGKGLASYEKKSLVNSKNPQKRLEFHLFKSTLMQDPRLEINFHVPDNKETFNAFK